MAHGRTAHPVFAIVTATLRLDPSSNIFTEAPERPIAFTTDEMTEREGGRFTDVADIVGAGDDAWTAAVSSKR